MEKHGTGLDAAGCTLPVLRNYLHTYAGHARIRTDREGKKMPLICRDNGPCGGPAATNGCCFECDWYDNCLPEIKCDQPEIYGICLREAEEEREAK